MSNRMTQMRLGFAGTALAVAIAFSQAALAESSPYAAFTGRGIKALSADRIDDLQAGRGAGYALAAELNGYPGPRHVLDLADRLGLTADQRRRTVQLFRSMQREARTLGRTLIARETALDRLFADGHADVEGIDMSVGKIAEVEAQLRATHLKYHLSMKALLTPAQMAQYNRLRGYHHPATGGGHGAGGHGH